MTDEEIIAKLTALADKVSDHDFVTHDRTDDGFFMRVSVPREHGETRGSHIRVDVTPVSHNVIAVSVVVDGETVLVDSGTAAQTLGGKIVARVRQANARQAERRRDILVTVLERK